MKKKPAKKKPVTKKTTKKKSMGAEIKTYPLENDYVSLEGAYWIGDPCYIFPDKEWSKLCGLMFPNGEADFEDRKQVRVVEVDGIKCYLFGTAFGDGSYPLIVNNTEIDCLGVDAGMLSFIPMQIVKRKGWGKTARCGTSRIFNGKKDKMYLSGKDGGNLNYGEVKIITDPTEYDHSFWNDDADEEQDYSGGYYEHYSPLDN